MLTSIGESKKIQEPMPHSSPDCAINVRPHSHSESAEYAEKFNAFGAYLLPDKVIFERVPVDLPFSVFSAGRRRTVPEK
jgi:hypothetical protein